MKKKYLILQLSLILLSINSCKDNEKYFKEEFSKQSEMSINDFIDSFGDPINERTWEYLKDSIRSLNSDERRMVSNLKTPLIEENLSGLSYSQRMVVIRDDKRSKEIMKNTSIIKVITRSFKLTGGLGCGDVSGGGRILVVDVTTPIDAPKDLKIPAIDKDYVDGYGGVYSNDDILDEYRNKVKDGFFLVHNMGCALDSKEITKSRQRIEKWINKWVFKSSYLGKDLGRLEFSKDGSYILSSSMFGGTTSKGTWEIQNGYNVGEALIILTPPVAQVQAGDVPSKIYVDAYEKDNILAIDETKYYPIKQPY